MVYFNAYPGFSTYENNPYTKKPKGPHFIEREGGMFEMVGTLKVDPRKTKFFIRDRSGNQYELSPWGSRIAEKEFAPFMRKAKKTGRIFRKDKMVIAFSQQNGDTLYPHSLLTLDERNSMGE